jgi:hypothetical protein
MRSLVMFASAVFLLRLFALMSFSVFAVVFVRVAFLHIPSDNPSE